VAHSVLAVAELHRGESSIAASCDVPITADNKANHVVWLPSNVDVGTIIVNKANVDAFFHKK
jgi:hypothetical protein